MKVFKYGPIKPHEPIDIPGNVVHFDVQHGELYVWSQVSDDDDVYKYEVFGTGWDIPDGCQHIQTAQTNGGFVWHLFYTEN